MALTHDQARAFYDRFGRKQDAQGFYEDAALDALLDTAAFAHADSVFEFGCGTGRFAARLLRDALPTSAHYVGCDSSLVMVALARERLAGFGARAVVHESSGAIRFPLEDAAVDRVVSTYVLDLLGEADIERFMGEAHRVLRPGGLLCLVGLTKGEGAVARVVSRAWQGLYRLSAAAVGGCRPLEVVRFLDRSLWHDIERKTVAPWGISSEVVVARAATSP
ncbi:MAG: class I SAM-dependent methyltransferase [Gammaproteobacteria bacterium]|nr:class I SAM-dependent methyltransferase [Gammaproteobacteria bacterium]